MFKGCIALNNLNLSEWNTKNVGEMKGMFNGCNALTNLDISKWNTFKCL